MWREMSRFGNKLVKYGLVESHFGNISVRIGDRILITKSGCALDEIDEQGVIEVPFDRTSQLDKIASSETAVHRAIYQNTSAHAIIHAHCPFSVTESLLAETDMIVPLDSEGKLFLREIPIVKGGIGTVELADGAVKGFTDHNGIIVHGHGTIALGATLDEAYVITTQLEHSCKIKYWYDLARK
ncbi:MAG: aldolase [Methanosarcinaceae archaeon]|nr:aldolase [Methanosarcinaceae archaeon]